MVDRVVRTIQVTVVSQGSALTGLAATQDAAVLATQNAIMAYSQLPTSVGYVPNSVVIGRTDFLTTNGQFQYSTTVTYVTATNT